MQKIVLVAESGSDLMPHWREKYGIHIVPMYVTFGEETKDDGSFPVEDVCNYYNRTGKAPKTSGSNPEDFISLFDEIHANDPDAHILYLAYSAVTTCAYQSAVIAAQGRDYVTCLDTKQVSVGQSAAVVRMARLIEAHPEWNIEQIKEAFSEVVAETNMCFIPSNLDYLRAGGRVSNAAAIAGNILGLKPCIEIVDGYLKATKKYRGNYNKVLPKLIQEFVEKNNLDREEIWLCNTVQFSKEMKALVEDTVKALGFKSYHWTDCGGVITTHGGPNAFGIAGYSAK
ncbi:MAG: DegV family protein [Peptococcaceae bacterium]|jgi:DegV family protein with EDD domain|nr:DegV family protein [Peptococcaceae bacterium]MBQ2021918.1 DegV family protein [Peptococcaceae bacterium]MBQ2369528.1 DegV family protein [Peptococcaceae bacterium]MBQ2432729.1 DegV family protein [Peptococcaceae bacterium]MBQ5369269.1 DegV family protein [Peptococcaceae bacterium]